MLRGLPYGAVVTVTETDHAGYTVTNSSRSGDSGAAELTGGDRIDFVNSKRAVPDMGLSGPTLTADEAGVVFVPFAHVPAVIAEAERIAAGDQRQQADIHAGLPLDQLAARKYK